jgi:CubicO group peptidase (beta-lactamase class C family)
VFADGEWAAGLTSDALGGSAIVEPDGYDNAWARPAGFAFASARDLGRVLRFLRDGDLSVLDPSLLAEAQSPQINTEELGDLAHYGYALRVLEGLFFGAGEFRRMRVVTHGGAIPGFSAELWWFPALDLGIVTLANTDGAYFRETVVTALRELTLLPPPEPPPDVAPDPNDLAGYAGTYFDRFNVGSVAVELDGGGLRVSLPALDRAGIEYEPALLPVARRNFLFTVQGHPLLATFVGNPPRFFRTRPFIAERAMTARSVGRSSRFDAARFLESVRSAAPPPWWLPPASP